MGISSEMRDRLQNHKIPGVSSKHYDRYDYWREKQNIILMWEEKLNSL
ncbi:integrase [Gilliamella apicola]|nr:integrase [Gilliamella apicola]